MTIYRNPFRAAQGILATEGGAVFFTGLGAVLLAAAPAQALYFCGILIPLFLFFPTSFSVTSIPSLRFGGVQGHSS